MTKLFHYQVIDSNGKVQNFQLSAEGEELMLKEWDRVEDPNHPEYLSVNYVGIVDELDIAEEGATVVCAPHE